MKRGKRIETSYDYPPIPARDADWSAYVDPEGPIGRGPTEMAAIADLLYQLEDAAEEQESTESTSTNSSEK